MRRILSFICEGMTLGATLDDGTATTGLLIVSGGNEIRIGAHRGMAKLAADVAAKGYPVIRFDRRGIGESEGENGGFSSSGPDIAAAITAFKQHCPALRAVIGFGNCDGATALVVHKIQVDGLVLANPWVIEPNEDLPPAAAIRSRYSQRLRDPKAWFSLISGRINIGLILKGLSKMRQSAKPVGGLAQAFWLAFNQTPLRSTIILAKRDNSAIAFTEAFKGRVFEEWRARSDIDLIEIDSASHSFAPEQDYAVLLNEILGNLEHIR